MELVTILSNHCEALLDLTTLIDELQRFGVANSVDKSCQFRSALVSVVDQLRDEDGASAHRSLQAWWQWLEDSGLESHTFASVLRQITNTIIGDFARQELETYIHKISTEVDGLPRFMEHVQDSYPKLTTTFEKLEVLAIHEQQQLEAVAGGMDKRAKDTLIGGAVASLIFGGTAFVIGRSLLKKRAELAVQEEYDNLVDQSVREKEHLKLASEKVTKIEVDKAISDPEGVIRIKNSIQQYGLDDIEKHAELLTLQHISKFGVQFGEKLKLAFKDSVKSKELDLLLDPNFAPTLQKGLEKKTNQVFTFEQLEETINQIESNEFDHSFELKAWNDLVQDLKKAPLWKQRIKLYKDNGALQDAWDSVYSNMKSSYRYLVSQEVEEAIKMMDEDAMTELKGWIKDGEEMIKLSETKIQEHLQYYEQEIIGESRIDLQELEQSFDSFHED